MPPVLFQRYPLLAERLPHLPLLAGPTPVQRLARLEPLVGAASLWVKRDDRTAQPYGGNKPRKLEFLLGAARAQGARTLITFGGLGSNHALATACYGRRHGFAVTTILVPQPVDDHVRRNLAALRQEGARVVCVTSSAGAALAAGSAWLLALGRDRRRPYLIPPGGSSPVGSLGYVSAALELADQIGQNGLPVPAAIFVAGGSNGTAAGLLVGLRLAGLSSRLIVVRVSDRLPVHARAIARLATATAALLSRGEPRLATALTFGPADLEVWEDYLGAGYGHPTPAGDQAVQLLAQAEGLVLDRTYTGKTMAALLDAVRRPAWRGQPLLYWHTSGGGTTPTAPPVGSPDQESARS